MNSDEANSELEYAKEFWTLANAITAFAIIQMITYMLAVGASDSKIRPGVIEIRRWVLGLIVFVNLLYCAVIGLLSHWQIRLLRKNHVCSLSKKLWVICAAKISVILLSTALGFWITWEIKAASG
jgi:hypothetical protein